jgi:hypothetical protein
MIFPRSTSENAFCLALLPGAPGGPLLLMLSVRTAQQAPRLLSTATLSHLPAVATPQPQGRPHRAVELSLTQPPPSGYTIPAGAWQPAAAHEASNRSDDRGGRSPLATAATVPVHVRPLRRGESRSGLFAGAAGCGRRGVPEGLYPPTDQRVRSCRALMLSRPAGASASCFGSST